MENDFYIPQSPLVKDTVCSFWQVHRYNNLPLNETIVPKGIVEIIFIFDTRIISAELNKQPLDIPRCFIQGFHTYPVQLHITGPQTFFGVVLHPTAVQHILHCHPSLFTNRIIDLTLIDNSFYNLWHCLGEQSNFNNRVTIFTEWLLKRLPQLTDREKEFNIFLNTHSDIHLAVSDLASRFCYSTKQLSRKLYELTGLNTEQILRYKKYLQAVHLMHYSELSLTEIAYSCQFYDQSHFVKTFKLFSQLTPKEYKLNKSSIIGHILENVH